MHYGLASATYETAMVEADIKHIKYQMIYSFMPAALSFAFSWILLFTAPLALKTVLFGFTGLMITQLMTLQVDLKTVEKDLAPKWFLKFRSTTFSLYMIITTILFFVYYNKLEYLQRKNDPNRI
jgi:hypothetical protein